MKFLEHYQMAISRAVLEKQALTFDNIDDPVQVTASTNLLDFEGTASADVTLTGLNNVNLSGSVILEETGSGNTVSVTTPASVTTSYTLQLPPAQGGNNTVLVNNGAGVLTWNLISQSYNYTTVNTATYAILTTDEVLAVDRSATGTCTLTLPAIGTVGTKKYFIIDTGGNANEFNITIDTTGGDTIIGDTEIVISENYNAVSLLNDGTSEWFIF